MRLTLQTDYGCRILIYLAVREGELVSAADVAEAYDIPLNHVKKIITHLVKGKYVVSLRGRNGGIKIARLASEIRLGEVIRYLDEGGNLLRCMDESITKEEKNLFCILSAGCHLKSLLAEAQATFLEKMNQSTLKDIIGPCEIKALRKKR
ncbi:Rrf2 family transcriptional regulator [Acetobacteraceae bacterium]|nr:Rrf2 family transcriptional regulator [Acetobacteraceae bacterium]